jgi:hypothetical protein
MAGNEIGEAGAQTDERFPQLPRRDSRGIQERPVGHTFDTLLDSIATHDE